MREKWIDYAKGIGILCVIYGHLENVFLKFLVYIFHMPLFFFLSGYTYKTNDKRIGSFIKHKIKKFLIPYFVFGIINGFIYEISSKGFYSCLFVDIFKGLLFQQRYTVAWFILTLFIIEIMMYPIIKLVESNKVDKNKVLFFSIIIYCIFSLLIRYNNNIVLFWNIDLIPIVQLYFYSGYYFKNDERLNRFNNNVNTIIILSFITIILGCLSYYLTKSRFDLFHNHLGLPVVQEFALYSGILSLTLICKKIKGFKIINDIGKNSIYYYGLHYAIIMLLQTMIMKKYFVFLNNYFGAFLTMIICITSVGLFIRIRKRVDIK